MGVITLIFTLCFIFIYDVTEYNELDSVKVQGQNKMLASKHSMEKLLISEAMYNESIVYITNIITVTLLFLITSPITYLVISTGLTWSMIPIILIEILLFTILSNEISGRLDEHFDEKWINTHKSEIQRISKKG